MTVRRSRLFLFIAAGILAAALLAVRWIAIAFDPAIKTSDHPVLLLVGLLLCAGTAWFAFFVRLRTHGLPQRWGWPALVLLGLGLRLAFFGSQPIYENDYKRYLWDGAVTAQGSNPYSYSPTDVFDASQPGTASVPDLARLAVLSNRADGLTGEINSPDLTTIYPPVAQAVFALSYKLAPFDPNGLRGIFLLLELIGLGLMCLTLRQFGRPLYWSAIYWLNPIIILTTYNGIHMDVLLVPPLMASLWAVKARPFLTATALSAAAAIKIWPLLLAPVLFRNWRTKPFTYVGIAAATAVLTGLMLLPMFLSLNAQAGLAVYSTNWTNSSFLFPGLRDALGLILNDPNRVARYVVALVLIGMSLYFGFPRDRRPADIHVHLMALIAAFVFLSPTGYPWYFIWFLMFLPFAAQSWMARGLALLTIGATAYYARFWLGEAGHYDIYSRILLPLEFGVPLLVLVWDGVKARQRV